MVVADHTRWGVVGPTTMADLRDAHVLVTDDRLRPDARALLSEHVGERVLAPVAVVGTGTG